MLKNLLADVNTCQIQPSVQEKTARFPWQWLILYQCSQAFTWQHLLPLVAILALIFFPGFEHVRTTMVCNCCCQKWITLSFPIFLYEACNSVSAATCTDRGAAACFRFTTVLIYSYRGSCTLLIET